MVHCFIPPFGCCFQKGETRSYYTLAGCCRSKEDMGWCFSPISCLYWRKNRNEGVWGLSCCGCWHSQTMSAEFECPTLWVEFQENQCYSPCAWGECNWSCCFICCIPCCHADGKDCCSPFLCTRWQRETRTFPGESFDNVLNQYIKEKGYRKQEVIRVLGPFFSYDSVLGPIQQVMSTEEARRECYALNP